MRNHQNIQSPRTRRIAAGAAALLLTGVLGTAVAVPALSSGDGPASSPPAAAVPSPPAPVIGRRADLALRWSQSRERTRLELCTAAPISADGFEHCIQGGR